MFLFYEYRFVFHRDYITLSNAVFLRVSCVIPYLYVTLWWRKRIVWFRARRQRKNSSKISNQSKEKWFACKLMEKLPGSKALSLHAEHFWYKCVWKYQWRIINDKLCVVHLLFRAEYRAYQSWLFAGLIQIILKRTSNQQWRRVITVDTCIFID